MMMLNVQSQLETLSTLLRVWAIVAVSILIVTLVLDVRDFVRWLGGERGLIDHAPGGPASA